MQLCFIGIIPVYSRGDPIDGRATVTFDALGDEGRIGSGKEDGGGGIGGGTSAGGGGGTSAGGGG